MALRYVRKQTALPLFFFMSTFPNYYINVLILEYLEKEKKKKKHLLLYPDMITANIWVYFSSFVFEQHIHFSLQNTHFNMLYSHNLMTCAFPRSLHIP